MYQFFLITSNVLLILTLFVYFLGLQRGTTTPNASTWAVWTVVGIINLISYFIVADNNIWKTSYVLSATVGLSIICFYAAIAGRFSAIQLIDKVCLALAAAVIVIWQQTGSAIITTISLQGIYIISFVPTCVGVWKGRASEHWLPWTMAVVAYGCAVAAIPLAPTFNWAELAFPIINGVLGNGAVVVAIIYQHQTTKQHPA